jgi:signal transduction histidine kinase
MFATLALAAIYLILLGLVILRRSRRDPAEGWMLVYCVYSVLLMILYGFIAGNRIDFPPPLSKSLVVLTGFMVSIALAGYLTLSYLTIDKHIQLASLILLLVWFGAVATVQITGTPPFFGTQVWFSNTLSLDVTLAIEIAFIGWLVITLLLLFVSWYAFTTAPLPLYANRILFWTVVLPLLLFGDALTAAWLREPWNYVAYAIRLIGTIGAVYAVITHRVIDLREMIRQFISRFIITIIYGSVIVGGVMATAYFRVPGTEHLPTYTQRWIVGILVALVIAILLQPITSLTRLLMRNLISRSATDPAEAVRRYGQRISGMIDLEKLASVAVKTINELLATRRSYLILATPKEDQIALEIVGASESRADLVGFLATDGPIYKHFVNIRHPLLQYDIEYHKHYITVPESERSFLRQLDTDIYAPVGDDSSLVGILAVGPKTNDDPFRPNEIELLEALATQTVAALENARLVTNLRTLNEEMITLNENLLDSNQRLERLDGVKSDFITIASHELRTPLTQVQGYSDLLKEMAERRVLDPNETADITQNLSKASQRMADIITAMLEVSQVDVDTLDLTYGETNLSMVIKLAVEPYAEAIRNRKQVLVGKGLSNLPLIHGDLKRLVQVFQNLITNAVKFTPDGGKIEITGQVYDKDNEGNPLSVRVSISDNGIGIDEKHHELIFEKFYRVGAVELHSSGTTKFKGAGPGLGLPLARGIIVGHGGRIWVESKGYDENKRYGSTFHVVLPVKPPQMKKPPQEKAPVKAAKPVPSPAVKIEGLETEPSGDDTILL